MNDRPEITTDEIKTATVDELYSVDYEAIDIDLTDTLTWTLDTNASSWLTINSNTGVLSGTPELDDIGTYWINVTVSDGKGGSDWQYFNIKVKLVNMNPVITTDDVKTAEIGKEYSVDYEATDDRTPVVSLIWSMKTNASWLSFESGTGVLSGTPQTSDVGSYWVKITVGDGEGGFANTNFTIRIAKPPNTEPELSNGKMSPSTGDTDTKFTFSVRYEDDDGDPPQDIKVVIDGVEKDMTLASGDPADGVYEFEMKLAEGPHDYYFIADDGIDDAEPGDTSTPVDDTTAASTPEIKKAEPKKGTDDQTMMYIGIVMVIIIIVLLLAFMFLRGRGAGEGGNELEAGKPGAPKIVGPVDEDELEGEEVEEGEPGEEVEEFEEEEYPYEGVSEPSGYEDMEVGEVPEDELAAEMERGVKARGYLIRERRQDGYH
jgi:hypothetical protein